MADYLARVSLKQADGRKAVAGTYTLLHAAMETIGLLRFVKSRENNRIYKLPHATYAGRCERDIDDMLTDIEDVIRNQVLDHHPQIVIGACEVMRISGLETAGLSQAAEIILRKNRFLVTC